MPPLNTTTVPPGDNDDVTQSWIIEYIWLPYVLLGLILVGMALASFIHYHFQNRGKYAEKKAHSVSKSLVRNPAPGQSKQKVTLHSRGAVNNAIDPQNPDPDSIPPASSGPKSDMFVASIHSKENTPRGETSPDSSVSTAAYANESYDSNCDSDKSLLSSESGAKLPPPTKNKKRPRSRSPRRRTNSVEPAPPSPKAKEMRKAKSMDVLQKDSSSAEELGSQGSGGHKAQGSASTSRSSRFSSPPPSTARLETPVIPDNSRPRTQHKSRTGEVNVLKIHHEEDD